MTELFVHERQTLARIMPRDYQERGIVNAFEHWDAGQPGVLLRQPTGSGKTTVATLIADHWLTRGDKYRVLVLAHERQLIQQFSEEIDDILGIEPAIEMAGQHCTGKELIIVGSRQTIKGDRMIRKFNPHLNWLLIIDECHRWAMKLPSCAPIIEHFAINPNSKRLGLTATPERTDKTTFEKLFPAVASDYRLYNLDGGPSAVNDGWAVEYDQRFVTVEGVDFKSLREVRKDFDEKELERVLSEQETLARLVDPTLDLVGNRRTVIFNPGVAMAKAVALYINAKLCWEAAIQLDGSHHDEDRKHAYRRHQSGDVQFLSVCGLCREGYNDPGIQAVAVFRPTKSRPLAEQMKGRGCRPLRGVVSPDMSAEERRRAIAESDKPNCMIVDLVGITGMADCASTAHILAAGKPDEVIDRANRNALAKSGPINMADEIRQAEQEIELESEKKRKRQEQRQKYAERRRQKKIEEDREREEYRRLRGLEPEVHYHSTKVGIGRGGKTKTSKIGPDVATDKQRGYIKFLGLNLGDAVISKNQASRIIGQLKSGMSAKQVLATNRIGVKQAAPVTTNGQTEFWQTFRELIGS